MTAQQIIPTHVDDMAGYLGSCSEAFGQIAAVLTSLREEAKNSGSPIASHLEALAGAGLYLVEAWRDEVNRNGVTVGDMPIGSAGMSQATA